MQFTTKNGDLTPYALVCGYKQTHANGSIETELWQECPGLRLYHVRQYDFEQAVRIFWDTYEKLSDARKAFKKASKLKTK